MMMASIGGSDIIGGGDVIVHCAAVTQSSVASVYEYTTSLQ